MKNRYLRSPLAGVALVALSAIVLSVQLSSTAAPGREYTFSTDADVAVVEILVSGGLGGAKSRHTIFGDGRLVHRPRPDAEAREVLLTYTETDEIVRTLIDGGIMDWNRADVARRLEEAGAVTDWIDIPTTRLTINLERYQNGDVEMAPARKEISISWLPALIRRWAPDAQIPEVDAIDYLHKRVRELLSDAEE